MIRHDGLTQCFASLAKRGMDTRPCLEQVLPQLATHVRGQVGVARMDVVLHSGTQRHLVDDCVVSPLAGDERFVAACARRDGHAARRAAMAKRSKYHSPELVPFAVETGGRFSPDARHFVKAMADCAVDPVAETAYIYRALSSMLQDAIARQLLSS